MSVTAGEYDLPVVPGALAGAAAWAVGYLFTYVLAAGEIRELRVRRVLEFLGVDLPTWKVVGWVFYDAHFVGLAVEGPFDGSGSFVGGEGGLTVLLYALPPLLLLGAGLAVARARGATTPEEAAAAGAAVVAGYLPPSVLGVVLFVAADGAARPDPVAGLVLAGVVYPAVFGTAGAAVGVAT